MSARTVGSGRLAGAAVTIAVLATLAAACVPLAAPPPPLFTPGPPVYNVNFPDPDLVRADPGAGAPTTGAASDYRGFSTNAIYGYFDWPRVPTAKSTTLAAGSWGRGAPTDALPEPFPATWQGADPRHAWWAPAVHKFTDTWVMYYTAPAVVGAECIGAATSATVDGPYQPFGSGPLVCDLGIGGSIDPAVVVDGDGRAWLLWKNDGNCCNVPVFIWSAPLAADGLGFVGPARSILGVDQAWEDGSSGGREPWKRLIEGPTMVADSGSYWLFYSANWWDGSKYAIGYARCTSPAGGCVKPSSVPLVGSGPNGAGPGGPDVVTDAAGQLWLAFHAWTPWAVGSTTGGWRALYLSRLSFAGGSPTLGPGP